ncbi:MAG: 6-bladed beta-propeller, partial [Balneolaceae bacterium]|nr:6-bladed beta-propeller [Balneolaceae bacterium]
MPLVLTISALQAQEAEMEEYFSIERVFELEQNEESFLASPMYSFDNDGEILAADVRLNKVKIFDSDGLFVNSFGREGRGPGDFSNLISAVRMDDGNILTADVSGRLTLFSDNGEEVIETYNTPVIPLMGVEVIDSEKVLIYGRGSTSDSTHLIHLLDLSTNEIIEEFLDLDFSEHPQILRILTNISSASVDKYPPDQLHIEWTQAVDYD